MRPMPSAPPAPPAPGPGPLRRLALLALSATLSAVVIAALLATVELPVEAILEAVKRADRRLLLAAVLVSLLCQLIGGADKLRRVVLAVGGDLTLRTALAMRLGAGPLRLATPFKSGGAANVLFLRNHAGLTLAGGAGCLAFDRGLNLVGLLFWMLIGVLSLGAGRSLGLLLALALTALLLVFLIADLHHRMTRLAGLLHPRLGSLVGDLLAPFAQVDALTRLGLLCYGLLFQSVPSLVAWLLFAAVGAPLGLAEVFAFVNTAMLVAQIPGPLAGIGLREASLVALVGHRAPEEAVLAAGLLLSLTLSVLPLLIGLPLLPWYLHRLAPAEQDARDQ